LSSYQLETAPEISPSIGIWTNLTPDHLERHGSFEAYSEIKRRLLENSKTPIYNADDRFLIEQKTNLKKGLWVSTRSQGPSKDSADFWINKRGMILEKGRRLFHSSVLQMNGNHNLQNLLLVIAAARTAGIPVESIEKSLKSFSGVPHRLEKIGYLHDLNIFNDSKATNYESAKMGLMAVPTPTIILAGGQAKKGDPSEWLKQIQDRACGVVLFGACRTFLKELIDSSGFKGDVICCENLNQAVGIAIEIGTEQNAKSILLSPACASFDQYKDYEERGNHFKELIGNFHDKS